MKEAYIVRKALFDPESRFQHQMNHTQGQRAEFQCLEITIWTGQVVIGVGFRVQSDELTLFFG